MYIQIGTDRLPYYALRVEKDDEKADKATHNSDFVSFHNITSFLKKLYINGIKH